MATQSITEEIPLVLRDEMDHPEVLSSLLPSFLTDLSLEEAIHFINGAYRHQEMVQEMKEESNSAGWFRMTLEAVEVIERESGGKVLGKKLRLHFKDKGYGKDRDKVVEQSIDTGWIEFNGWGREAMTWEIALANTLADIAEAHVGKDLAVQKYVDETDDGKVRHAINIHVINSSDSDRKDNRSGGSNRSAGNDSRRSDSGSSSARGKSSGKYDNYQDRITDALDKFDVDQQLNEEDETYLSELFSSTEMDDKEILENVTEYLGKTARSIRHPEDESDDQIEWAIQLLLENI